MSEQFTDRDVNDVEAIIAVVNTDVDAIEHTVADHAEAIFTWDYEKGARPALQKLYEKAKRSQWNVETDIDWSIDVDPAHVLAFPHRRQGRGDTQVDSREPRSTDAALERRRMGRVRHRIAELAHIAVLARRAGRAHVHRQDRRDLSVDRREVLRRDPGDGRSPPRRGLRASICERSSTVRIQSTPTCVRCSTTSFRTAAGT